MKTQKTCWTSYYKKSYKLAFFSRNITGNLLKKLIKKYKNIEKMKICELGGANSCFFDLINTEFKPKLYTVIDNNKFGLKVFANRLKKQKKDNISLIEQDALNIKDIGTFDLVFSVGLIEHFSTQETELLIKNHFNLLAKNGILILAFPTPTFLYKVIRKCSELMGWWIFLDERPISLDEAEKIFSKHNIQILEKKITWIIGLTQAIFVLNKTKKI